MCSGVTTAFAQVINNKKNTSQFLRFRFSLKHVCARCNHSNLSSLETIPDNCQANPPADTTSNCCKCTEWPSRLYFISCTRFNVLTDVFAVVNVYSLWSKMSELCVTWWSHLHVRLYWRLDRKWLFTYAILKSNAFNEIIFLFILLCSRLWWFWRALWCEPRLARLVVFGRTTFCSQQLS